MANVVVTGSSDLIDEALAVSGNDSVPRFVELNVFGQALKKTQQSQHAVAFRPEGVWTTASCGSHSGCQTFSEI